MFFLQFLKIYFLNLRFFCTQPSHKMLYVRVI